MKLEKKDKQYDFANLSEAEIQQVSSLEQTISMEKGEEVILIAYRENESSS